LDINKIVLESRTYEQAPRTHSHSFGQLIIPLEGKLYIETEINQLEIDRKHLYFLPPEHEHTYFARRNNKFLVMDIPENLLSPVYLRKKEEIYIQVDKNWDAIRILLLQELKKVNFKNYAIIHLFNYFSHLLFSEHLPLSIRYINEHFNEKLSIKELAAIENYSSRYYSEWFINITGMTLENYIQKLRLKEAKYLLMNSNLSILQIALQVGYKYQSSLNALFKKFEGKSPSYFRKYLI
jgi:AraC-like DNA-binding protein